MNAPQKPVPPGALEAIRSAVGDKGWTDDAEALAPHLADQRGLYRGRAAAMVRPASTDEVAAVVAICHEHGVPIVPQGGNTGLVGASVPFEHGGEILLNLGRMNRIRDIDTANDTMTAEAGCVLANLQAAADDANRLFPLSLGAEGSCQIGGNLSTNAGGVAVLRYGSARQLVLGLEVVLPDGRVWNGLRGLRKDNTGYDLKQLFLGAEGTLGIITAAVLRLFPKPRDVQTAFAAVPDPAASVTLLERLRGALGDTVTGYELMPRNGVDMALRHIPDTTDPLAEPHAWYVLVEVSSGLQAASMREAVEAALASAMEEGLILDAVLAASQAQTAAFWRLREGIAESQRPEGGSIKHDVSVPVSRVAAFIEKASAAVTEALPGIRPVPFGHVGDGNIHFNLSQPEGADAAAYLDEWERMNRIVHDIVAEMGGSISAEHGIGRLKRDELVRYRSDVELDLMRALKRTVDPKNIMNPGKVV